MLIKKDQLPQVANMMMNILHEEEIDVINKLYDAVLEKDEKKIDEMFELFLADLEDHLSTEEKMMKETRYWATAMHKAEHDTMREKVRNLYESWKKNRNPDEIKEFLEKEFVPWLNLHISRWDAETAMHIGDSI